MHKIPPTPSSQLMRSPLAPSPDGRSRRRTALGIAATLAAAGLAGCAESVFTTSAGSTPGGGALPLVFGRDGNIFAMSLDGRSAKQLTRVPRAAQARDPAWSPDGARLVYAYTPPLPAMRGPGGLAPLPVGDVYAMNADGSEAKVLVPNGGPGIAFETPAWAPDGKSLFVTYTELVVESNIVRDQIVEVARVPLGGGTRQTLVPDAMFPAVSPNGRRLVCVGGLAEGQTLLVADADGKNPQPLLPPGRFSGLAAPRFSPDGKQVVFSAFAPFAPTASQPVPQAPTPQPSPPSPPAAPTPVRRAAAGRQLLAWAGARAAEALAPFLPRVARAHGLPMDLFVVGADGGQPVRLTQLGEDSPSAAWSPDGKRLAFVAGGGVYLINADGTGFTQLDHRGGHGNVDWKR